MKWLIGTLACVGAAYMGAALVYYAAHRRSPECVNFLYPHEDPYACGFGLDGCADLDLLDFAAFGPCDLNATRTVVGYPDLTAHG
jgi:hypothetical protein